MVRAHNNDNIYRL